MTNDEGVREMTSRVERKRDSKYGIKKHALNDTDVLEHSSLAEVGI